MKVFPVVRRARTSLTSLIWASLIWVASGYDGMSALSTQARVGHEPVPLRRPRGSAEGGEASPACHGG